MGEIANKLMRLEQAKSELDAHIWQIFGRYIRQENILFSHPENWYIEDNSIHFTGQDGCKGCYDGMALRIPISFFDDPETEFPKLAEQRVKEKTEKEENAKREQEAFERREFERLKNKFYEKT
jgi:hypothetical protein